MRITTFLGLITSLVLISACNKKTDPAVSASAEQAPALTIAKESREQLQKAKDVSKEMEKSAEKQKQAIDDINGDNASSASKTN